MINKILVFKKVTIEMPAFFYSLEQENSSKGIIYIEGKYSKIFNRISFKGFIEINGERFHLENFIDRIGENNDPIMVLASVIKKTENAKKAITAYTKNSFSLIKGTVYRFEGSNGTTVDFAAPANNLEEAEKIEKILESESFGISIIGGKDGPRWN